MAQTMERMLEAARQGYWKADPQTVAELKARWRDLAERFDVRTDNARFQAYVGKVPAAHNPAAPAAPGFGLDAPLTQTAAAQAAAPAPPPPSAEPPQPTTPPQSAEPAAAEPPVVSGLLMAPVPQAQPVSVGPVQAALLALLLAGITGAGALRQACRRSVVRPHRIPSLSGVFK